MPYAITRNPNNPYRLGPRRNTLKRRRNIPEPVPPIAFLMLGHGSQPVEWKTVPKGCVLVVSAKSGEPVMQRELSPKQLRFLDLANRDAILDPVHHKGELYKLFGPVSIFTEGDLYPDFHYSLLNYHPSKPYIHPKTGIPRISKPVINLSGIVKLEGDTPANPDLIESIKFVSSGPEYFKRGPKQGAIAPLILDPIDLDEQFFVSAEKDEELPDVSVLQSMSSEELNRKFKKFKIKVNPFAVDVLQAIDIPRMFKFSNNDSINSDWIDEIIQLDLEEFSEEGPRPSLVDATVVGYIEDILTEPLGFSQEYLFEKCGPGVYYNFICRSMESNSTTNPFQVTNATLQGISEAEGTRKHVVRKGYNGTAGRRENQRISLKTQRTNRL
jgi:hypothetical protein